MLLKTLCVIALTFVGVHAYAQNEDSVLITSLYEDTPKVYTTSEKTMGSNMNVIKANYGIGWFTSEFADFDETNEDVSSKCMSFSYQHFWHPSTAKENWFIGLGASYIKVMGKWHGDINLTFVGPTLAFARESENGRWRCDVSVGIGYGESIWGNDKLSGFGAAGELDVTYKFTKNVGVCLGFNMITLTKGKESENVVKGSQSLNLKFGPVFFF